MSLLWQISSSSIAACYQVSNYIYQTIWQFCTLVYFCENGNNSVVLNLALYFVPCYLTSLIFSDCIWAGVHNIKGIATHPYRHVRYLNMYVPLQILNVTGMSLWSLAVSTAEQCCCVVLLRRAAIQAIHILTALWSLWRSGMLTTRKNLMPVP